ncbi:ABC transporter permease [Methylocystis sp. B8]|uniref:ABC transporter permease n=1 Tax=Methylocystis sp. B8 TaxID=544938 RepID=UPI0010FEF987|nr:ABC transporter permease [Methylocystis sp. B8]TLG71842.1 ABC transporter permease [Methylocystis sp. B8]
MSLRDLNRAPAKFIPRGEGSIATPSATRDANYDVEAALSLVMEKAVAIREFERATAQALTQARDVAVDLREQLNHTEVRAERAEEMLRLAEGQVEQFAADVEQIRNDLEDLQSQLAVREAELVASTHRADAAETAVQKIIDAIRTHLPVKLSTPSE